jgi:hypothetical protein
MRYLLALLLCCASALPALAQQQIPPRAPWYAIQHDFLRHDRTLAGPFRNLRSCQLFIRNNNDKRAECVRR